MADNLHLGPEATVNHSVALLRAATFDKAVEPEVKLVAGVFLSVDPDVEIRGRMTSISGELLTVHFEMERPARWAGLHFQMGDLDFGDRQLLGVVCRSQAPKAGTFRICLRSGNEGGFHDMIFRKTVVAYAEPSIHLDALELARESLVPKRSTWRELILFFQPETLDVSLLDFHVFVV